MTRLKVGGTRNRSRVNRGGRGPPGVGFSLTENDDYDMKNHRLCNVADPKELTDAVNMQFFVDSLKKLGDDLTNQLSTIFVEKLKPDMVKYIDLKIDNYDKTIKLFMSNNK